LDCWAGVVIVTVSCRCVRDAGFRICPSSSRKAFMRAFKSRIRSFDFYSRYSFDSHRSHSFTRSLVGFRGLQSNWFEGVHIELTDAGGGVAKYSFDLSPGG
jgi:hypothetical protein